MFGFQFSNLINKNTCITCMDKIYIVISITKIGITEKNKKYYLQIFLCLKVENPFD